MVLRVKWLFAWVVVAGSVFAQDDEPVMIAAPDRGADEGGGPYSTLIIRGGTLIDGTGAPPIGPVDIVIEGNRITDVKSVGYPGLEIDEERRPGNATREIDAHGSFVMPGIIDMHTHTGGSTKAPEAEYSYKLWMGHGITTVRGVPSSSLEFSLSEKERSAKNEIVAPRIFSYHTLGSGERYTDRKILTPEEAREWVRYVAAAGADGLKLGSHRPAIMEALLDEGGVDGVDHFEPDVVRGCPACPGHELVARGLRCDDLLAPADCGGLRLHLQCLLQYCDQSLHRRVSLQCVLRGCWSWPPPYARLRIREARLGRRARAHGSWSA